MTGLIVVAVALAATAAIALVLRVVNGRFRSTEKSSDRLTATEIGAVLGSRATLVQFSTAFCGPCRATRALLTDVSSRHDDVEFVEIDAESHLELVRQLDVLRTPTVFVLDREGAIVRRASGQPKRDQIDAVLAGI
jgi:thiol-disulfide isomerase/thioredoxin